MALEFGTDGIRGVANVELTGSLVLALGRTAAGVLGGGAWVIGRDTRQSGPVLAAALTAGLAWGGAEVIDLGVVPTPAVAFESQRRGCPGAMISASHNPYTDNGVKLFAAGGLKLSDAAEEALETAFAEEVASAATVAGAGAPRETAPGAAAAGVDAYMDHLRSAVGESGALQGRHVVVDCANGAASALAQPVLESLGVRVDVIHNEPDGTNINAGCGSTHPESLQAAVVGLGADLGLALDGDADRVLAIDHCGALVDGDHLLAIFAIDQHEHARLAGDTVVITVMTNLGFRLAMAERSINVVETQVGDRYVLEAMEEAGFALGGEQSGHVIFRDMATTGDGLLTGLRLLDVVGRSGRSLADLAAAAMTRLPQVLRSVRVSRRDALASAESVWQAVAVAQAELGDHGRVVLRSSGTEPVVRVMVEAPTLALAERVTDRLCVEVAAALG